jgi:hypothetical protein
MPRLSTQTYGGGDMSWLDGTHAIGNARTDFVDISTFVKADNYPNGYIPSGTPVAKVGGVLVPYTSAEGTTTNAGILWGHILTDQPTDGVADFAAPVLKHGRVVTAKVPKGTDTFSAPVAAAKRAQTNINYV